MYISNLIWKKLINNKFLTKEEISKNFIKVFLFFAIAFILNLSYIAISDIFRNNLSEQMKSTFYIIMFVGFFIGWVLVALSFPPKKDKGDFWIFLLILIILFLINKFSDRKILLIFMYCSLFLITFILPFFLKKKQDFKKIRIWFLFLFMFFIFFAGTLLINTSYGYKPAGAYLNLNGDQTNRYELNGQIKCFSFREKILTGMEVKCVVEPELNEINYAILSVTDILGNEQIFDLTENMSFIAPKNSYSLYFEIKGVDNSGEEVNISTIWQYTFLTWEEDAKRQENLAKYFLSLLGLVFVTIPLMFNQIIDILNKK